MATRAGRQAVEWVRTRNPWASGSSWVGTHSMRMYTLGLGARWLQPPARFVIVTPGRSGSELLTDLLDSHPGVVCEAEILRERLLLPERFIEGRAAKAGLRGARAYGFKIHCGHFGYQMLRERPQYLRQLADAGVQLIFLRRENFLAQAISSTIALRTRWHWRREDRPEFQALDVDPVEVLMMTYLFEESDHYLGHLLADLPHLALTYERDLRDGPAQQVTVARICDLLRLPAGPTSSEHVRFTPRRLPDAVTNYDAVAELVRPTRFRRFLEDDSSGPEMRLADPAMVTKAAASPAENDGPCGAEPRAGGPAR